MRWTSGSQAYVRPHSQLIAAWLNKMEPATARDRLVVETEVAEVRRASSRWAQRIRRVGDDRVLVEGMVTAGVCDAAGKPMRPPADLMAALATLQTQDQDPS